MEKNTLFANILNPLDFIPQDKLHNPQPSTHLLNQDEIPVVYF